MTDYYEILGVEPTASVQAIKKSFRAKIKEQHPDVRKTAGDSERMSALLIQAYKILSDSRMRAEYDRTHHFFKRGAHEFSYREFLKSRKDDLESQARLIFFDLLHDKGADAVSLYEELMRERAFILEEHLDREDFMDCAYLLSEIYENDGRLASAFELLVRIAVLEFEKPYFKHFFYEVTRRLQAIACLKMTGRIEPSRHLDCLTRLSSLDFPKRFVAQLFKKAAELSDDLDDPRAALSYLDKGLELDRRLAGAGKLRQRLERAVLRMSPAEV